MIKSYKLNQNLVACVLLISLLLQSCGKFSNLTIPEIKGSIDVIAIASTTARNGDSELSDQELTNHVAINQLVSQEFTAEGAYIAISHNKGRKLQADKDTYLQTNLSEPNGKISQSFNSSPAFQVTSPSWIPTIINSFVNYATTSTASLIQYFATSAEIDAADIAIPIEILAQGIIKQKSDGSFLFTLQEGVNRTEKYLFEDEQEWHDFLIEHPHITIWQVIDQRSNNQYYLYYAWGELRQYNTKAELYQDISSGTEEGVWELQEITSIEEKVHWIENQQGWLSGRFVNLTSKEEAQRRTIAKSTKRNVRNKIIASSMLVSGTAPLAYSSVGILQSGIERINNTFITSFNSPSTAYQVMVPAFLSQLSLNCHSKPIYPLVANTIIFNTLYSSSSFISPVRAETNQASDLNGGLIAHYTFDGNTLDSSGHGYNAKFLQGSYETICNDDRGLLTPNADPIVVIPEHILPVDQGSVCVSAKIVSVPKNLENGEGYYFLATLPTYSYGFEFTANDGMSHSGWVFRIRQNDPGAIKAHIYTIDTYGYADTKSLGKENEEIHICTLWNKNGITSEDGRMVALYRNAINIGKHYWVDNRREWPTQMGAVSINKNFYNPSLDNNGSAKLQLIYDDIRIYNYALSPIEIQNLYSELSRTCTDKHDIEDDCEDEANKAFTKGALLGGAATAGALIVTGGLAAAAFGFWKKRQQYQKNWQEDSNQIEEFETLPHNELNVSDVNSTATDNTYKLLSINT